MTTVEIDDIKQNDTVSIEIKGEIEKDMILNLKVGSTIEDALNHIKLTENADLSTISLMDHVYEHQIIVIPAKTKDQLISINNASLEELCNLKGISNTTALKIIEYRIQYHGFNSLEELMNVSGIGPKKFETIKQYICL